MFTAAVGIKLAYDNEVLSQTKVCAASPDIDLSDIVTEPITDMQTLKSSDKMRHKMEAFITNLQGKIVKELQTIESDGKFVVDRWMRSEVFKPMCWI